MSMSSVVMPGCRGRGVATGTGVSVLRRVVSLARRGLWLRPQLPEDQKRRAAAARDGHSRRTFTSFPAFSRTSAASLPAASILAMPCVPERAATHRLGMMTTAGLRRPLIAV